MSANAAVPSDVSRRVPVMRGDWSLVLGLVVFALVVAIALLGPFFAPHDPAKTIGSPAAGSMAGSPLGLDALGRDVLSRLLWGGRSVFLLAGSAVLLTYLVGITVGLIAGYSQSIVDPILMRAMDVLLSVPGLLVMLLAVTALGNGSEVLVGAYILVGCPPVSRIVRAATLEVSTRGHVEAAVARGESSVAVLTREILPNILAPIIADLGIRFAWAIALIASVNYLGLGLQPPAADWGLMISENRGITSVNALSVVAPAVVLGLLVISVNLVGDAYVARHNRSRELS